jgi:hypothetical protein
MFGLGIENVSLKYISKTDAKSLSYKSKKFDTIAHSFNFFLQNINLFTFSELPSVGFYQN